MANMTREEIMQILEQYGGLETINRNAEAHGRVFRQFCENEATYLAEYPDKWIVITLDGVAVVGDDMEEVFAEARRLFAPEVAYLVWYMDSEQDSWIL